MKCWSANAESLPFEKNQFDLVSCIGSLERILNRRKALNEIHRVLKPGGRACFMVRISEHYWWRLRKGLGLQNKKGHQDAADLNYWKDLINSSNFHIAEILPDHWPYYKSQRFFRNGIDYGEIQNHLKINGSYEFIFSLVKK